MILRKKGLALPDNIDSERPDFFEIDPDASDAERAERQIDLILLAGTDWPADVKAEIVLTFMHVGVPDPLYQKIVEPFAMAFKGRNVDGASDYSRVDWVKVVDYFKWEAQSISGHTKEALELQAEAMKKYGHWFNHYNVYDPR
jgi:hypothetical protein